MSQSSGECLNQHSNADTQCIAAKETADQAEAKQQDTQLLPEVQPECASHERELFTTIMEDTARAFETLEVGDPRDNESEEMMELVDKSDGESTGAAAARPPLAETAVVDETNNLKSAIAASSDELGTRPKTRQLTAKELKRLKERLASSEDLEFTSSNYCPRLYRDLTAKVLQNTILILNKAKEKKAEEKSSEVTPVYRSLHNISEEGGRVADDDEEEKENEALPVPDEYLRPTETEQVNDGDEDFSTYF